MLPYMYLFYFLLILSTLYVLSCEMLFSMWIGLEMNMMAFILIMFSMLNIRQNESIIKYFLVQVFGSMIFLSSTLMMMLMFSMNIETMWVSFMNMFIFIALCLKLGVAPFHFWFPGVMDGLSWLAGGLLMTWQKLAPLFILSSIYMVVSFYLIIFLSICSSLWGGFGGLNQINLRKLLAYSSISHLGWLLLALVYSDYIWKLYFIFYSMFSFGLVIIFFVMNWNIINQMFLNKSFFFITFMVLLLLVSLGGLPPLAGFVMKWVVLMNLINNNLFLLSLLLILGSILSLYYYFRLLFMFLFFSPVLETWSTSSKTSVSMLSVMSFFVLILPIIFSFLVF